ncbi:DMT family transporter [Pseudogracilibacillus sp. SO10305]|uniref:DMT family transporter n=1 Tax=Pseudogracilibacillus sp. SO10305 TaxID=3098292 RepID=UPI00300E6005
MRPIIIGIIGSLFFSTAFIFNRSMELAGGSWIWSASLRYYFMFILLLIYLRKKKYIVEVIENMKKEPLKWIVWSTVGFGLFYSTLSYATVHAPGWLVAATFQLNIVAGSLLTPIINKENKSIPIMSVLISFIIIAGVAVMQMEHVKSVPLQSVLLTIVPLIVASVSYPVGNRKMMQVVQNNLSTTQRILGMTIASMPFWIILSVYGLFTVGAPSVNQVWQTFVVAIFAGVIATILYFYATELVKDDNVKLAGVEATVTGAVIFALLGELLFLHAPLPEFTSFIGMFLIISGIVLHSITSVFIDTKT